VEQGQAEGGGRNQLNAGSDKVEVTVGKRAIDAREEGALEAARPWARGKSAQGRGSRRGRKSEPGEHEKGEADDDGEGEHEERSAARHAERRRRANAGWQGSKESPRSTKGVLW